jgi:O-antigen ligase
LAAISFLAGAIALYLTFSRGAWLGSSVSIILLTLFAWKRGWLPPKTVGLVVVLLLLFLGAQNMILARLVGDDGGAAAARGPLNNLALRIIQANPLLGVGANNFAVVMKNYLTAELSGIWLYTTHNKYLLVWAEIGTGGFLVFVIFLLGTVYRGLRVWRFNDRLLSSLGLALALAVAGHMNHMFVDVFNGRSVPELLWLVAGIITAMVKIEPSLILPVGGKTQQEDSIDASRELKAQNVVRRGGERRPA